MCIDNDDMELLLFCEPFGVIKKNNIDDLLEYSAEQMAISDELGGFTVLFGTQDFLTAEQKNPFPAFDVIIREILSRMAMSDEVRTLLGLKQERDKTANMLLTEGGC